MSGSVAVFGPDESVASVSGVTGSSIWGTASLKHEPAEKESDVTGKLKIEFHYFWFLLNSDSIFNDLQSLSILIIIETYK